MTWALIVHGGAKEIEPAEAEAHRAGVYRAALAGRAILQAGGSAIDAVENALRVLEDDPTFNCGYGSALNDAGEVEMCSGLMDGATFDVGAVSVLQGVRHPISVARALLRDKTVLLSGPGARAFAQASGQELCEPWDLIPGEGTSQKSGTHDTVGCVALDTSGLLVAGTSTGGLDGTRVGRVGDSPMPGCGYYADNRVGAVALSGDGELIARKMLAARAIFKMAPDPDASLLAAINEVAAIGGEAGLIAITPDGRIAWQHNSRDFAVALCSSAQSEPRAFINLDEMTDAQG